VTAVNERTITLKPSHLERLRGGKHVWWDDNTSREVGLYLRGTPQPEADYEALLVELSPADLGLVEAEPEGLVVADVTGTTGWTVRMGGGPVSAYDNDPRVTRDGDAYLVESDHEEAAGPVTRVAQFDDDWWEFHLRSRTMTFSTVDRCFNFLIGDPR